MRTGILLTAFALELSSCATVKLSPDESAALKVLQKYLELDRSGVRLDSARQSLDAPLVAWTEEPGWDSMIIATGWSIARPQLTDGKITARVRYDVAGLLNGTNLVSVDSPDADDVKNFEDNTEVVFTLVSTKEGWKIESPTLMPHVGFPAARRVLTELGDESALHALSDAEYEAKLKGARAGHCNCGRLDF